MGGVAKAIEKPFRTGRSAQARAQAEAMEQARLAQEEQNRLIAEENERQRQAAETAAREAEQQRVAAQEQAALSQQTMQDTAAEAPEVVAGGTAQATDPRRKRRANTSGLAGTLGINL